MEHEVAKLDAEIDGKIYKLSEMLEESFSHELISSVLSKYTETNMELQDACEKELIQVGAPHHWEHC